MKTKTGNTRPLDEVIRHVDLDFSIRPMTEVELQYAELIMAVARKFPGETRHQTALRYIQEAEQRTASEGAKVA